MREKSPLFIEAIVGLVLIAAGWITQFEYYSSLILWIGFGLTFSSVVHIIRIAYWESPRHREEYAVKKQEAHINSIDERKQYLRMKSGHIAYQIMLVILLVLSFVLVLLRVETWISGMIYLLFVFHWISGAIAFHFLEKRM